MSKKINNKIDRCLTEFRECPTPKKLGTLVALLTELLIDHSTKTPVAASPQKRPKNEIEIKDESGRIFVIDEDEQKWYELFAEAKVDERHKRAFEMIVEYFGVLGITSKEIIRKKDIVIFVLECEEHKEDGKAGLFLHHYTTRWELGSLDPTKQLTGVWDIIGADENPSIAFDMMMEENYPWSLAYPEEE